jgi:hypothetical protein
MKMTANLNNLVHELRSNIEKEWKTIWRQYPYANRTDEERQIVREEHMRILGYTQALDDILANVKDETQANGGNKKLALS